MIPADLGSIAHQSRKRFDCGGRLCPVPTEDALCKRVATGVEREVLLIGILVPSEFLFDRAKRCHAVTALPRFASGCAKEREA